MKFESRRAIRCAVGTMILCLLGTPWARSQSAKPGADRSRKCRKTPLKISRCSAEFP